MPQIFGKKRAIRVKNTTESPNLFKKIKQIADFSVVITEQSKFIKPVDTAILSMIPEGDLDLTTYLNELLGTNKPGQQKNTFWSPENLGIPEDHTPVGTRILRGLQEVKE